MSLETVLRASVPLCILACLTPTGVGAQAVADWPGWRGPGMDLSAPTAGVFRPGGSYRLEVAWKRPLGTGYSAISVVGGTAVTLFVDGEWEYAGAFDTSDGEERWRARLGPRFPGRWASNDGPISTPLIQDGRIFALDPGGRFFALDLESGDQLWMRDLLGEHDAALPFYGFSTSAVAWGDSVIVQTGGANRAVTAFDAKTGETLWSAGEDEVAYQSPMIARIGDQTQLLVPGNAKLFGIDPDTGRVHWTLEHGGDTWAIGGKTGYLVRTADNRFYLKNSAKSSIMVELSRDGETTTAQEHWKTAHLKNTYVPAVHHEGYLFGYNGRILSCVDAETGERAWRSRPPGDGFPIVVDGHLVIATKDGSLRVAPASPEGYQEIARLDLFDDLIWAPASFARGSLYVRSLSGWARVEIVEDEAPTLVAQDESGVLPDTEFGRFVAGLADAADRVEKIDVYLAAQPRFPIIEGKTTAHFVYRGPARDMALSTDLFGWRIDRPMNRVLGTDLFYYSTHLEPDTRVTYTMTRDFEEPIPIDPRNPRRTRVEEDEEVSVLEMLDWAEPRHLDEPEGAHRGQLEELELKSGELGESLTLKVYLPAGYDASDERLGVAYVLAGESALGLGRMSHTLDNLIGRSVEPVVVVFVPFFGRFPYETYVGAARERHARVLAEEVVPRIDGRYRTRTSAESRAVIGNSYGAYGAVYAAATYPELFGKLGLQSVFWEPGYEEENRALLRPAAEQPLTVYLDWGRYDLRSPLEGWDLVAGGRSLAEALREKGHDFTGGEVNAGSGWSSWRTRTDRLLETLFPAS